MPTSCHLKILARFLGGDAVESSKNFQVPAAARFKGGAAEVKSALEEQARERKAHQAERQLLGGARGRIARIMEPKAHVGNIKDVSQIEWVLKSTYVQDLLCSVGRTKARDISHREVFQSDFASLPRL